MASTTPALDKLLDVFGVDGIGLGVQFYSPLDPTGRTFVNLNPTEVRQLIKELEALLT